MKSPLAVTLATLALAAAVPQAWAQDEAGDAVNTVFIYGEDPCPQSTDEVITVCARMDESERYRIPPGLRRSNSPSNESWAERVRSFEQVGRFGQQSCSPIGAGGELGCTIDMIEAAYAERAEGEGVLFSQLIAAEREERLSEIDAEAEATQARVEELEREYMRRLEQERDAPLPDEEQPLPQVVDPADIPERPPTVD